MGTGEALLRFCVLVLLAAACRPPAADTHQRDVGGLASAAPAGEHAHAVPAVGTASSSSSRSVQATTPVLSVGGDVKAPVVASRADATITADMKCRGLVLVDAIIDGTGRVQQVQDVTPAPDAFTRANAQAVKRWYFHPATL